MEPHVTWSTQLILVVVLNSTRASTVRTTQVFVRQTRAITALAMKLMSEFTLAFANEVFIRRFISYLSLTEIVEY